MLNSIHGLTSRAFIVTGSLTLCSFTLNAQPSPKPTAAPPVATEVLRIRPTYVIQTGIGHGYTRVLARVDVLTVGRSASGVRAGSSLLVTSAAKSSAKPLSKGKIYRAFLFRHPTNTTEKREPLYVTVDGFNSFQLLKAK